MCGMERGHLFAVLASIALAFACLTASPTVAEDAPKVRTVGGVIDYAAVFTPEEKRPLEVAAGQLARRIDTDMFVVSINDREAIWADQKSHFAMVERAFTDIQAAVRNHFGRDAPLTIVLVFKSSVVLHLKTSDKRLQDDLVYQNFYSKSAGALERIRREGEPHGQAAARYLAAFGAILDELSSRATHPGILGQTEKAHQWIVKNYAMPLSRNIVENPILDPLYKLWCTSITFLATHMFLPGWISFLLIVASIYLGLHAIAMYLEKSYGRLGETAGDALTTAGSALPLFMLFAVAMPDLENLLVIAQKYANQSSVLLTYLDWSSAIEAHSFKVPFAVIVATAVLAAILEFIHRAFQIKHKLGTRVLALSSQSRGYPTLRRLQTLLDLPAEVANLFIHILTALGWGLSQVIWPGPIAAFFMIFSIARRIADLASDYRTLYGTKSKQQDKFIYHHILKSGG